MTANDRHEAAGYPSAAMVTKIGAKNPRRVYLREWRKKKRLTQQQVADRIGVSKGTVSRWESVDRTPDIDVLSEYADALGLEVPDLFFSPDKPTPSELLRAMPQETVKAAEDFLAIAARKTGT